LGGFAGCERECDDIFEPCGGGLDSESDVFMDLDSECNGFCLGRSAEDFDVDSESDEGAKLDLDFESKGGSGGDCEGLDSPSWRVDLDSDDLRDDLALGSEGGVVESGAERDDWVLEFEGAVDFDRECDDFDSESDAFVKRDDFCLGRSGASDFDLDSGSDTDLDLECADLERTTGTSDLIVPLDRFTE
jgi:hypothetical protein